MLLTSKGAAGVAGGGFIALAATLSTVGTVPAIGIMLVFGIDKFMSECRALVNFIGNAVATLFVASWDKALDRDRARRVFAGEPVPDLVVTEPSQVELAAEAEAHLLDSAYHRAGRTDEVDRPDGSDRTSAASATEPTRRP